MEGGAVVHYIERGPPKDHPGQICFNLVQRFQRRRLKCEKLTDDRQQTMDDGRQVMAKAHLKIIYLQFTD